jgi:hypothetical protein
MNPDLRTADQQTSREVPIGRGGRPSRLLSPEAVVALAYGVPNLGRHHQAHREADD